MVFLFLSFNSNIGVVFKRMKQETNIKNNPKIMKAWAFYDWANSVYSLVITSTIFPIYYSIITTAYEKNEYVAETGKWIKVPVRNVIKDVYKRQHKHNPEELAEVKH